MAAPSANPFGFVSPTTAQHVADQLAGKVDYILDGGPCAVGLESTIVSWADGGAAVVELIDQASEELLLKQFKLQSEQIEQALAPDF